MFKKILIVVLILAILCGIGYLGYVVFMAKNIEKVEMVGSMQSIYFVDDSLDFENAQIKVTYKNGDMKLIDLKDNKDINVSLFSSSISAHGKMKITYKNFTIEQEYNVFEKGYYFVDSKNFASSGSEINKTYDKTNTVMLLNFLGNGMLRYYHRATAGSEWFMNDGKYDTRYNYNIVGNIINVKLNDKNLELKANYTPDGKLYLGSKEVEADENYPELVNSVIESTYTHYPMKENLMIDKEKTKINYQVSGISENYLTLKRNETLNSSASKVYLEVHYSNASEFELFKIVYVEVCTEMNNAGAKSIDTNRVCLDYRTTQIYYGSDANPEEGGANSYDLEYIVVA